MPQPFASFKTTRATFYDGSPAERPILAVHIATVLGSWSQLETLMGFVFSRLLGTEEEKGIAVYNSVSNLGAHGVEQLFRSVVALALPQLGQDFAQAIRTITAGVRNQRNPIAHGIWGISDAVPDGLLLRSPREALRSTGDLLRKMERLREETQRSGNFDPQAWKLTPEELGDVFVYREADFVALRERIFTVRGYWTAFEICFLPSRIRLTPDEAELARRRLFGPGEVLDKVNRLRVDRREPPLTPVG